MRLLGLERPTLGAGMLLLSVLLLVGCAPGGGSDTTSPPPLLPVEDKAPGPAASAREGEREGFPAVALVAAQPSTQEKPLSPRLLFVEAGEATPLENGGRIPVNENVVAEVFLAPYPPVGLTDLHLFFLDRQSFKPIVDSDLRLAYEMQVMDHGNDTQLGAKVGDGHYVQPLAFQMYGDWSVDVVVQLPGGGAKRLQFIVKVYP